VATQRPRADRRGAAVLDDGVSWLVPIILRLPYLVPHQATFAVSMMRVPGPASNSGTAQPR
jgi:hypothetical protein